MARTTRSPFEAEADGLVLGGWVEGDGVPVLLLHGGPGLSYGVLDPLAAELRDGYQVAAYQQRGLPPSSLSGPFEVADHVQDVRRVLDALGWSRPVIVGHSWGGHLGLHVAVAMPERTAAVLAVDPLGAVGDGGEEAFEAEIFRRVPAEVQQRAEELDAQAMRGEGTEDSAVESLRLVWPAYFPRWDTAPAMPATRISLACYSGTYSSLHDELPRLEAALPSIGVPVGFPIGEASPMPASASTDAAERIPDARVDTVPGAGHFPWLDVPGSVRSALDRLVSRTSPAR